MLFLSDEEKNVLRDNKGRIGVADLPKMKKATKEVSFIKLIRILQRCPYSKFFAKPMDYIDEHVTSKEDARRHVIKLLLKSGIRLP